MTEVKTIYLSNWNA